MSDRSASAGGPGATPGGLPPEPTDYSTTPAGGPVEPSTEPTSTSEPSREELLQGQVRDLDHDKRGDKDPLRGSRTSGVYAAVIALGIVLVLLIIFIAQNTRKTTVSFLGWEGQVSVAVALLIAAAAGLFLAGMAGLLRILQLRRRVRRVTKAQRKAAKH